MLFLAIVKYNEFHISILLTTQKRGYFSTLVSIAHSKRNKMAWKPKGTTLIRARPHFQRFFKAFKVVTKVGFYLDNLFIDTTITGLLYLQCQKKM